MMGFGKKQIIDIIVTVILVIGLGVGIYLVQKQQTVKSKASGGSFVNAFEIKDKDGNIIQCDGNANPPTCTTRTLDIRVRVRDANALR